MRLVNFFFVFLFLCVCVCFFLIAASWAVNIPLGFEFDFSWSGHTYDFRYVTLCLQSSSLRICASNSCAVRHSSECVVPESLNDTKGSSDFHLPILLEKNIPFLTHIFWLYIFLHYVSFNELCLGMKESQSVSLEFENKMNTMLQTFVPLKLIGLHDILL